MKMGENVGVYRMQVIERQFDGAVYNRCATFRGGGTPVIIELNHFFGKVGYCFLFQYPQVGVTHQHHHIVQTALLFIAVLTPFIKVQAYTG